ncbi:MAG: cyclic nucleotide-binding domain-containing protein [Bacillota bacterium]
MRKLQVEEYFNLLSELGSVSFFHYLSEEEKKQLLGVCEILSYDKDERIVKQGEIGTCLYAVLSGTLSVTIVDMCGKEIFLSTIKKGEFFGEAGIFYNLQRTANVFPATDTAGILRIERKALFEFIQKRPSAGVKILILFIRGLLDKLSESNKELAGLRGGSVLSQNQIDRLIDEIMERIKTAG